MSKKGIRFKGNIKAQLYNLVEGEVVYATDTQEWGLCTQENDVEDSIEEIILWRKHMNLNEEQNISRSESDPTTPALDGHYHINSLTETLFQFETSRTPQWQEISIPLVRSQFNYIPIIDAIDYSQTIKDDGSVNFRDLNETEPEVITHKQQADNTILEANGANVMEDNDVLDNGQVIFKKARVGVEVPTSSGETGSLYWDVAEDKLKIKQAPQGHIRYYTTTSLTFSTGARSPTNGYIDVIGNDGVYLPQNSNQAGVTKVEVLKFGDRTSWFSLVRDCGNMTEFIISATDECKVTNFRMAWDGCSSLTSFPLFDTSKGTSFSGSWSGCSSLTSFPLLDTSSGTTFYAAWIHCTGLTSFPLIDTSKGTNFQNTWYNNNSLTSFPLLDVSKGTIFQRTWQLCSSLTSFPLLDTSSGTNFWWAWDHCSGLTSFPSIDVSKGTNFTETWSLCTSLTSFPLLDTSSGTSFSLTWYDCSSLTSFPSIDVSSGTNFSQTWRGCTSLPHCPGGNEVTIPSGATTPNMCYGI